MHSEDCRHIFDESVLAFILEWKSGKFTLAKESITLVTPYCLIWGVLCPILNTSVGYCLFGQRYSRTSIQIDDSAPHFLFTQTAASGVGAVIKIHYYYGVLVISSTQSVDCAFRP